MAGGGETGGASWAWVKRAPCACRATRIHPAIPSSGTRRFGGGGEISLPRASASSHCVCYGTTSPFILMPHAADRLGVARGVYAAGHNFPHRQGSSYHLQAKRMQHTGRCFRHNRFTSAQCRLSPRRAISCERNACGEMAVAFVTTVLILQCITVCN